MYAKKTILLGYSGHGYVVAEAALLAGINVTGYAEKEQLHLNPYKLNYMGFENNDNFPGWHDDYQFILGIGDNKIRGKVAATVINKGAVIVNAIHPDAKISTYAQLGMGNFIARGAMINPLAIIKNNCILNTGCIIEHECVIGDNTHIAPGAVLAGNVSIGENSFIGANAVIRQGVTVGNNVIVGAGSVILKNVPDNKIMVGNPARAIK